MESIWTKTYDRKKNTPLEGDIDAEAAVIGGGMAGIPYRREPGRRQV